MLDAGYQYLFYVYFCFLQYLVTQCHHRECVQTATKFVDIKEDCFAHSLSYAALCGHYVPICAFFKTITLSRTLRNNKVLKVFSVTKI